MPTGYTAALETMNYDVRRWLAESVIRAFGVMFEMREENNNLTRDELIRRLEANSSIAHYEKSSRESKRDLERTRARSAAEWKKLFDDKVREVTQENTRSVAEWTDKKMKHEQALAEIKGLSKFAAGELQINVLKFAAEQLTSALDFDFGHGPYTSKLPTSWEAFKQAELALCADGIKYAEKHLADERKKTAQNIEQYKQWLDFVDQFAARR